MLNISFTPKDSRTVFLEHHQNPAIPDLIQVDPVSTNVPSNRRH
jgi:hypothetical protein